MARQAKSLVQAAMRDDLGVPESSLRLVVREASALLHLIEFFTAGEKGARAQAIGLTEASGLG